jgi:hypothetical protein
VRRPRKHARHLAEARLIVIGISPGLRSLAYCVLAFSGQQGRPEVCDSDLLKGGRPRQGDPAERLRRKATPHALVLDVVFERAIERNADLGCETLVAVGPSPEDVPAEHAAIVRLIVRGMIMGLREQGIRIAHVEWLTEQDLGKVLGIGHKKAVRRAINHGSRRQLIRGEAFTLAAASALAAQRVHARGLLPGLRQA